MAFKSTCPGCGVEFTRIGKHWADGSCEFPSFTSEQREVIAGLIMGDGSLGSTGSRDKDVQFPYFEVELVNEDLVWWIANKLEPFTSNVNKREHDGNRNTSWRTYTTVHPGLQKLEIWWKMEKPAAPPWDLDLSPLVLKTMYATRGSLAWGESGCNINISSENASHLLRRCCDEKGWEVVSSARRSTVTLSRSATENFLDYLGDPLPGCEYLWEVSDEKEYRRAHPILS